MLPEIRCPCLVLVGKHDAISTLEEMRFRRAIRVTLFAERESSAAFAGGKCQSTVQRASALTTIALTACQLQAGSQQGT